MVQDPCMGGMSVWPQPLSVVLRVRALPGMRGSDFEVSDHAKAIVRWVRDILWQECQSVQNSSNP